MLTYVFKYDKLKRQMYMITVFTPTYNRGYIIKHLYDSLVLQNYKDFEWLVMDDGSTDDTEELFKSFIAEWKIKIHYSKVKNGGKHRAINKGLELARGNFFFIVDSDDYLPSNALERVSFFTKQIESEDAFAGVSGLRIYPDGRKVGGEAKYTILDTDSINIREKYKVKGDMAEVFKTEILKQYPFPEFEGEMFISEGIVWSRIAQKYKLRYFYEGIYICDYLEDGLTKSIRKHHRNSPKGTMLTYNQVMRQKRCLKTKVIAAINYWRYTIQYPHRRNGELAPIWWTYFFYPLGLFFYLKDSLK